MNASLVRVAGLGLLVAVAPPLAAQTPIGAVKVHVVDTAGRAIAGAEITIQSEQTTLAAALSDSAGRRSLRVPLGRPEYNLFVRSLGFARVDRFLSPSARDTLSLEIVMHRVAATLGPVVVSANVAARQHDYNIDADEIAKSDRWLYDVNDVIHKLRPMMWTSRSPQVCNGTRFEPYAALSNVYVNGQRLPVIKQYKPPSAGASPAMMPGHQTAASLDGMPTPDNDWIRSQVTDILHDIKAEHVAELHYLDCYDTWMEGINARNALYIVLKPGVAYDGHRGSYVLPTPPLRRAALQAGAAPLPPYRPRVIGVFAANGGFPLADVAVVDDSAGLQTLTLSTGAASLAFLPEGRTRIRLSKAGYRDTSFVVSTAAADTVPITVLLEVSDTSRKSPPPRPRALGRRRDR